MNAQLSQLSRSPAHITALTSALHAEARLLTELTAVMRRQRDAIARDDLDALDDAVFATHRVLLTLGEARRRRKGLNEFHGESDDLSLESLRVHYGDAMPRELSQAIIELSQVAAALHREVDVNRRVLRHAIDTGDQLMRTLRGVPSTPTTYEPTVTQPTGGGGRALIDRRI